MGDREVSGSGAFGVTVHNRSSAASRSSRSPDAESSQAATLDLAVCVSGEIRGLRERVHVWWHLVHRNLIVASGAPRADTFLVLSDVGTDGSWEAVRDVIQPVVAIASNTSDCRSPLMGRLCREQAYVGAPPRARAQFFWLQVCLDAVASREVETARAYDFTLRVRPDSYYMDRMPQLHSLDHSAVFYTTKMDQQSDMFYAIPRMHLKAFSRLVGEATTPPNAMSARGTDYNCCPELVIYRTMVAHRVAMKALSLSVAIMRPCVLECLFFPHAAPLAPAPSEWERGCHRVAEHLGAYSWTVRVAKMVEARPGTLRNDCYKWNHPTGSYRVTCCAAAMAIACRALPPADRALVGWDGCNRTGPEAAAAGFAASHAAGVASGHAISVLAGAAASHAAGHAAGHAASHAAGGIAHASQSVLFDGLLVRGGDAIDVRGLPPPAPAPPAPARPPRKGVLGHATEWLFRRY